MPEFNAHTNRTPDSQNNTIYRFGAAAYLIVAAAILLSIVFYFIWPYKPGSVPTEGIFQLLQSDRLGGLISLDLPMLLIIPINIIPIIVLYLILKQVNEFYALLALAFGLVGVVLLIPTRPLIELVSLSEQYAAAAGETARTRLLAEGDLLLMQFSGTAWFTQTVLFLVSGIINGFLMLRSPIFRRATALTNITISAIGLGFFIPVAGLVLLFLNTIGAIVFYVMVALDLFRAQKRIYASVQV
jgi:hypothetical protein